MIRSFLVSLYLALTTISAVAADPEYREFLHVMVRDAYVRKNCGPIYGEWTGRRAERLLGTQFKRAHGVDPGTVMTKDENDALAAQSQQLLVDERQRLGDDAWCKAMITLITNEQ